MTNSAPNHVASTTANFAVVESCLRVCRRCLFWRANKSHKGSPAGCVCAAAGTTAAAPPRCTATEQQQQLDRKIQLQRCSLSCFGVGRHSNKCCSFGTNFNLLANKLWLGWDVNQSARLKQLTTLTKAVGLNHGRVNTWRRGPDRCSVAVMALWRRSYAGLASWAITTHTRS